MGNNNIKTDHNTVTIDGRSLTWRELDDAVHGPDAELAQAYAEIQERAIAAEAQRISTLPVTVRSWISDDCNNGMQFTAHVTIETDGYALESHDARARPSRSEGGSHTAYSAAEWELASRLERVRKMAPPVETRLARQVSTFDQLREAVTRAVTDPTRTRSPIRPQGVSTTNWAKIPVA